MFLVLVVATLTALMLAGSVVFVVQSRTTWRSCRKLWNKTGRVPGSRPTHSDGTPYRYHELVAEGWGHCDGCHQWGQWTAEDPHDCPEPNQVTSTVTIRPSENPATLGAAIGRTVRRGRRDGI